MKEKPIIAIDGPAGAGKSTLAKDLARELGLKYIDSGAMYRAFGLKCVEKGLSADNIAGITELLEKTKIAISIKGDKSSIIINGEDVTGKIRTPEAGKAASVFSAIPIVREKMIGLQRAIGHENGVVMDGRDIGTVVFPDADIKVFLEAGNITRAVRRFKELYGEDKEPDKSSAEFQKILSDQTGRDKADMNRASSPLKPAEDAVILDSTSMSKSEVLNEVIRLLNQKGILKSRKDQFF